jgi:hypothetical protein
MQPFVFEAELTPLPGRPTVVSVTATLQEMLSQQREIEKGDAIVAYAELLKALQAPLEEHRQENLAHFGPAMEKVRAAARNLADPELEGIAGLLAGYREVIELGEQHPGSLDGQNESPEAALGLARETVRKVSLRGRNTGAAIKSIRRLGSSTRLVAQEGYRFLAVSTGPVGNPDPAGTGELGSGTFPDPRPAYMGRRKSSGSGPRVFDLHQVVLELKAPANARSFSFDFNFFSAEYPEYVNQSFNDTFYAILEIPSTNEGQPTNIAFDARGSSIEVDNNYFQQPFHPIPNTGTGFDAHGSTGWLRTSWPVRGGEQLRLTFSIHDEGDAIYDSLVLLDNFRWHDYEAAGATDPLN